mmetsp:Transcript_63374/g.151243  ORF Transcript_63374/g.151243 Transcript_63374/m.151243 type:complete len:449 (+) Transcript_63374:99-1445(+)
MAASSENDRITPKSQDRMLKLILGHQLSTLSLSLLTMQARMQLLSSTLRGNTAAVARQVSLGAALVALSDLLLSPSMGALSDRIGRKPLMLMAPLSAFLMKSLVALNPSTAVLLMERTFSDMMRTLGGTTMAYACLSDLYKDEAYTAALGKVNAATGLGIVLAPLLGLVAMGKGENPRRAYILSAALAAVHTVIGAAFLEETAHVRQSDQHPGGLADSAESDKALTQVKAAVAKKPIVQPVWKCLRLFTSGANLRRRACFFALHCTTEGKVLQDLISVMQLQLGWGPNLRSRWTSGLGMAILAGGQLMGALLKKFGEHTFTRLCHGASLLAMLLFRGSALWSGLALLLLGQQRRSVSSSWLISEAHRQGFGRGEAVGAMASLRAAVDVVTVVIYGAVQRATTAINRPSDVFALPALLLLFAEAVRGSIAMEEAACVPGSGTSSSRKET